MEWSRKYIEENRLKPNDRFLTENELSSIHGVSRQTVRQALKKLEDDNIISRVRGSGTFVKAVPVIAADSSRSACVGVISTYFSDYIFPSIITGIEGTLKNNGLGIQLATTHNRVFDEAEAIRSMIARGVLGLIVEPSKSALPNPNMALYEEITASGIPLVFFNARYQWSELPVVRMDDVVAARLVTDHLFKCGHTRISAIFSLDDLQGHERYRGFMESCEANGVTQAEQNVMWYSTGDRAELFRTSESRIMRLLSTSTAVVCYNDKLAVELMNFCRDKGIRVPEDISVTGIDNADLAAYGDVQLTTVTHPHQKLGESAAELLMSIINSETRPQDRIFTPELIVRDSVKYISKDK